VNGKRIVGQTVSDTFCKRDVPAALGAADYTEKRGKITLKLAVDFANFLSRFQHGTIYPQRAYCTDFNL
jgi:hypothetical protein